LKVPVDEDRLSKISHVEDLDTEVRENVERLLPPAPDAVMATIGTAALDPNLVRGPLVVGINQR
jgi:hypothetical protein